MARNAMFNDELDLKKRLVSLLQEDFDLGSEVRGIHPVSQEGCRIDFLCRPKVRTIELGFPDEPFGIEVKSPISKDSVKKGMEAIAQAASYVHSSFGGDVPSFVLLYPPIEYFFEYDAHYKYEQPIIEDRSAEVQILRRLVERMQIAARNLLLG